MLSGLDFVLVSYLGWKSWGCGGWYAEIEYDQLNSRLRTKSMTSTVTAYTQVEWPVLEKDDKVLNKLQELIDRALAKRPQQQTRPVMSQPTSHVPAVITQQLSTRPVKPTEDVGYWFPTARKKAA